MEDLTLFQDIYSQPEGDNVDASADLFQPFDRPAPPVYNPYPSFSNFSDLGDVLSYPIRVAGGAAAGVYNTVASSIKGTYLYLVFGIALIGIVSVFVLGAGTKFMNQLQGGK